MAKSIKRVWMQAYPVLLGTFLWWFSIRACQSGHPAVSFPPSGTWCWAAPGDLCCQPARWLVFWQRCYRLRCYWEKHTSTNKLIIRLSIYTVVWRADHVVIHKDKTGGDFSNTPSRHTRSPCWEVPPEQRRSPRSAEEICCTSSIAAPQLQSYSLQTFLQQNRIFTLRES